MNYKSYKGTCNILEAKKKYFTSPKQYVDIHKHSTQSTMGRGL